MDERRTGLETEEKGTDELDHDKMVGGSSSWKLMGQQSSAFLRGKMSQQPPGRETVLLSLEKILADLELQERELAKALADHGLEDTSNSDNGSGEQSVVNPVVIGRLEEEDKQLLRGRIECNGLLQGFLLNQIAPLPRQLSYEKRFQDFLRSRDEENSSQTGGLESDGGGHEEKDETEHATEDDEMNRDNKEQAPRIDSEFKSRRDAESVLFMGLDAVTNEEKMVESSDKPMLQPGYPSTNILDCGGDGKKDDEMGMAKSDPYWITKLGPYWITKSDKWMFKSGDRYYNPDTLLAMEAKEISAAKEMANEAKRFALYVGRWENEWGETCGFFTGMTALSSMQFTHYTPGRIPNISPGSTSATLQIFSIKVAEVAGGLKWPLSVYGVVAARDVADHNRNLLFSCGRRDAQELKEDDRVLRLIGPSRAIVFTDRVNFEIQLRVKGTGRTKSQDKALISYGNHTSGAYGPDVSTFSVSNCFCRLEFRLQTVTQTVQATLLDVQVVKEDGSSPFEYGGRVACSPLSGKFEYTDSGVTHTINPSSSQIVLLESKDGARLKGNGGYLHLWRQVVSVEITGRLDVFIQAYSKSGSITQGQVRFIPKNCGMSHGKCALGGSEVSVTVAWSLVATDKEDIALQGGLFEVSS